MSAIRIRVFVPVAVLAALVMLPAASGDGPRCCRDIVTGGEIAVTGTVESVQEQACPGGKARRHLRLKAEDGELDVLLGPVHYLDRQDVRLSRGDTVQVIGKRAEEGDLVVARSVTLGEETLTLRDAAGRPTWAGEGIGQGKGQGHGMGPGHGCGKGCCQRHGQSRG